MTLFYLSFPRTRETSFTKRETKMAGLMGPAI
jgi:hypothetical protein